MKLIKEPLFHFLVLGLVVFGWFAYLNPGELTPAGDDEITIDAGDVARLIDRFEATWRRPPTLDELGALQDRLLREELLVREARSLGLDQGDTVIRSRLAQKMTFLTTSIAQSTDPDDSVLLDFMAADPDRFKERGRVAFEQIRIAPGTDRQSLLSAIDRLNDGADPAAIAAPGLLPRSLPLSTVSQIDGTFGQGVFDALQTLPVGQWAGPVASGFGLHLVRVDAREDARVPPLNDIRDDVLFEWQRSLASDLLEGQYDVMKSRYRITTLTTEELLATLPQ